MKKVIIVGGGFAGSIIAKKLQGCFSVTLIDTKEYFEFTPGVLKVIANPLNQRNIQVAHKDYLRKTKVIIGNVKDVTENQVIMNNKKIKYDYLVVASGSSYNTPFKHSKLYASLRTNELAGYSEQLKKSSHVLIIGGGLVGVELAGELQHYFRDMKITLVSAMPYLLDRMPDKAQEYAQKYLEKKGVELIFEEKIIGNEKNRFMTDKGREIEADIAFSCTGITPNSNFMKKNLGGLLNERGFVQVDEFLRLKGHGNIFIAGDLTDIKEEKTAQNAERHAKVIVKNIVNSEKNKRLEEYYTKKNPFVISLGPYNGIFIKGTFAFSGLMPAFMKWFVERREMIRKKF